MQSTQLGVTGEGRVTLHFLATTLVIIIIVVIIATTSVVIIT